MGKGVLGARETRGGARGGREENAVPLLPLPSRVVSRPNSLPFPFERLPRSYAADFLQSQSEAMQRQRDPEMAQHTRLLKESPRLEF